MLSRLSLLVPVLALTTLALPACDSDSGDDQAADGGAGDGDGDGAGEAGDDDNAATQLGGPCEETPVPTGADVGDVLADFTAVDSAGNEISLYEDLCDQYVLLVKASFTCSACQDEAPFVGDTHQMLADQGFFAVTLLAGADDPERLDQWAEEFDLTHPVVSDPGHDIAEQIVWPGQAGRPKLKLLGPGAVVLADHPIQIGDIPGLIAE